jgi:citryl-CoA lyase
MTFETDITHILDGKEIVRGIPLETLVRDYSFVDAIVLLLHKRLPTDEERSMLDAILTSVVDHGAGTASAMNARISASATNDIHTALAAGILGFGERHGMAVTTTMQFLLHAKASDVSLREHLLEMKQDGQRVPGFGHKVFTDVDPRTVTLFTLAKETGIFSTYSALAMETEMILSDISSKPLPLNIDGAIGAMLLDMGFSATAGNAIFLIGRVPGLLAHIIEEVEHDTGIRRAT